MAISPTRTRRWTRLEYERLVDAGIFRPGERLELLAGHLVVREPQGSSHATAVGLAEESLRACFGPGWVVRVRMPIALDDDSEPESPSPRSTTIVATRPASTRGRAYMITGS